MRTGGKRVGFTLVEVVVVIMILGILAAFAVPRFATVEVETRSAATAALRGSLRSSAALAHALWLSRGQPAERLDMDGSEVSMAFGYPNLATIDDTLGSLDGFDYDEATGVFTKTARDGSLVSYCTVTYLEPRVDGEAPAIAVETGGC
jgi:MSHA pilin protein MshA